MTQEYKNPKAAISEAKRRKRLMLGLKKCYICRQEKDLESFEKHNHKFYCDDCIDNEDIEAIKRQRRLESWKKYEGEKRERDKKTNYEAHLKDIQEMAFTQKCDHCKEFTPLRQTYNVQLGKRELIVCKKCSSNWEDIKKNIPNRECRVVSYEEDPSWMTGDLFAKVGE